ncbi:uncharacterized protein isoform X1 [Leptinotarsa decemlineata]|uniref:uncharacterized protein isoform X1 n=1 Tax=Leptinotarsa decemlineata TaxID=7539 RepID=UPI003D3073CE
MKKIKFSVGEKKKIISKIEELKRIRCIINVMKNDTYIGSGLKRSSRVKWENVNAIFRGRVRTGVIINLAHKEVRKFLSDAYFLFKSRISKILKEMQCLKVNMTFLGDFIQTSNDGEIIDRKYFNTRNEIIDFGTDLSAWYNEHVVDVILNKLEEFQERDSGWALSKILLLEVAINKYEMGNGASFIRLPKEIANKHACVNLDNQDDACSFRAIVSGLYPPKGTVSRASSYPNYDTVSNIKGLEIPMPIRCITKFEKQNDISVNVYSLEMNVVKEKTSQIPDDNPEGYILQVDLEYPEGLHDLHKDFPFCPEHRAPPNSKLTKLMPTFYNETEYTLHYRNLKQALEHGLKLTKIHKVLKFKQSAWLCPYIELNTRLRTAANTSFKKNQFKLANNAIFRKTMENIRLHRIVKLVSSYEGRCGAKNPISSPRFHNRTIFDSNLMAIELKKAKLIFNKPMYVGMAILDLSKTCMFQLHYELLLPIMSMEKCKLLYTDTDSFIYELSCDDVYKYIIKKHISKFYTFDYSRDNEYNIPLANKKVSSFEDYVDCLKNFKQKNITQCTIRSFAHNVFSIEQTKIALGPYDDKRHLIPKSFDTLT